MHSTGSRRRVRRVAAASGLVAMPAGLPAPLTGRYDGRTVHEAHGGSFEGVTEMASEREIKAAAEALAKLLGLPPDKATEAARSALDAAERVQTPELETGDPETGDFVG